MKPIFLILSVLACTLSFAQNNPINAVATTAMVADVIRNVGGECSTVKALMGPGIDPHLYRASASDANLLAQADVIFYNGHNLEGRLASVLGQLHSRTPTVALAETIDAQFLLQGDDNFAGQADPHLWMNPRLWAQTAAAVSAALSELRPDCTDVFELNTVHYQQQLAALHDWVAASIQTLPENQRILLTAHDAFAYYGAAFDIRVEGIEGISTESEASIADIREAIQLIVETQIPAIFVESSISPRTIEAVQAGARNQGAEVIIGGELFGDAMGDEGTPEGSYIGMIRANTLTIVTALGGSVAPWPTELSAWAANWGLD